MIEHIFLGICITCCIHLPIDKYIKTYKPTHRNPISGISGTNSGTADIDIRVRMVHWKTNEEEDSEQWQTFPEISGVLMFSNRT